METLPKAQRAQLKTLKTLCEANGGDTRLSRKPTALIALGYARQTRVGVSGHAGKGSRYAITPEGLDALEGK